MSEQTAGEQQTLPKVLPDETERRALLEAIVYVAEEPLSLDQIADGLQLPRDVVKADLEALIGEYRKPERGIEIRMVANGYKMSTKPEHHDGVRGFVKTLRPKLKLSLPALETLAVVAYKQPITVPEIQAIRGVNVSGVINTLLNRKLITTAGRKKVIGRPMMYRTTKEFLIQFGLNDLSELPNLKELEELSRGVLGEGELPEQEAAEAQDTASEEAAPEVQTPEQDETEGGEQAAPGQPDRESSADPQDSSPPRPDNTGRADQADSSGSETAESDVRESA